MIEDFDYAVDYRGVRTLIEPRGGWPRAFRWLSSGMLRPQFDLLMGKKVQIGRYTLTKDPHSSVTVVQWENDRGSHILSEELAFSGPLDAIRHATAHDYWEKEQVNG